MKKKNLKRKEKKPSMEEMFDLIRIFNKNEDRFHALNMNFKFCERPLK